MFIYIGGRIVKFTTISELKEIIEKHIYSKDEKILIFVNEDSELALDKFLQVNVENIPAIYFRELLCSVSSKGQVKMLLRKHNKNNKEHDMKEYLQKLLSIKFPVVSIFFLDKEGQKNYLNEISKLMFDFNNETIFPRFSDEYKNTNRETLVDFILTKQGKLDFLFDQLSPLYQYQYGIWNFTNRGVDSFSFCCRHAVVIRCGQLLFMLAIDKKSQEVEHRIFTIGAGNLLKEVSLSECKMIKKVGAYSLPGNPAIFWSRNNVVFWQKRYALEMGSEKDALKLKVYFFGLIYPGLIPQLLFDQLEKDLLIGSNDIELTESDTKFSFLDSFASSEKKFVKELPGALLLSFAQCRKLEEYLLFCYDHKIVLSMIL